MRILLSSFLTIILLTTAILPTYATLTIPDCPKPTFFSNLHSERNTIEDLILIPNDHPHYSLIGSATACWYKKPNTSGLKPLIIHNNGHLQENQLRFLKQYLPQTNGTILAIGSPCPTNYTTTILHGNPTTAAIKTAEYTFSTTTHILILPSSLNTYTLNLYATPIASYLNIPLIFYENNTNEIIQLCNTLNTTNAIIIGNTTIQLPGINQTKLINQNDIQHFLLTIITTTFTSLNYITITNPTDIQAPQILTQNYLKFTKNIKTKQITILGKTLTPQGQNTHIQNIPMPTGYRDIKISLKCTPKTNIWSTLFKEQPILWIKLYDPQEQLVAYSSSLAEEPRKAMIQTLACNHPGNYTLQYQIYHGFKGGFFSLRGLSNVDSQVNIYANITEYQEPYIPTITNLSQLAPYLTSAHGGLLIANSSFSLNDVTYKSHANGTAAGPWYTSSLHNHSNSKVQNISSELNITLNLLNRYNLLQSYLEGPAWLALLGDTNTIPMHYYQPSQPGIPEKGLPSDNPYSLNNTLSVGRIISWDVYDASILIARTLFYQQISEQSSNNTWHNRFSFIFGEGFGETGGLFHQIPYAKKIQQYGFDARVYGDLRNSRQITSFLNTYTGANYIEYLGHGDWYWYTPSLYGLDFYSKAIDVYHVKQWVFDYPSLFLSSACLMGRIDGVPLRNTISSAFLHAGCNAFIGGTRETGSEAGLEPLEDKLIINNFSIGEALRFEKQTDQEIPTYYVRVLFGDPSFNPYEPLNGFSNQGRPYLI